MKIEIVVNMASGNYSEERISALVDAFKTGGAEVNCISTHRDGSADISGDNDLLCIAGGDGTVRTVLTAMRSAGFSQKLAIFPSGTINLIARELDYSNQVEPFVKQVMEGPRSIPAYGLSSPNGYCFACVGAGPDSRAIEAVSLKLKKRIGRVAYAVALVQTMFRWKRSLINLSVDEQKVSCEAFFVANGQFYAGPWNLVPDASIEKDNAYVICLKRARRRDMLAFGLCLAIHRNLDKLNNIQILQGTEVIANSMDVVPVQFDGDVVGHLPLKAKVEGQPFTYI